MALSEPVLRALDDFRQSVTGLGHVLDRQKAWSMFDYLAARSERPHYDDVQKWALDHRFSEYDASDMANMADDIHYLRERLAPGGAGWGRPDYWFAES